MGKGKSGNKAGLRSALLSQQTRLKKNEQVKRAAQAAEQKSMAPTKAKRKGKPEAVQAPQQREVLAFKSTDKVLLVGEGNFTFARALVTRQQPSSSSLLYLPPQNVTATAYDTEEECYQKYADAREIVQNLRELGVQVLFGIDATKLEKSPALKGKRYDRVVWNFPHAGKGITDQDRNILTNQLLILDFLRSAPNVLAEGPLPTGPTKKKRLNDGDEEEDDDDWPADADDDTVNDKSPRGTILVTLRNVPPYTLWDVPKLAKSPPPPQTAGIPRNPQYKLIRSFKFHRAAWPGYSHRMTKGERGAGGMGTTGLAGEDRTWEFCLAT